MVIVGRIATAFGGGRNAGPISLASSTSDNRALSNPADHGYRRSDCTAFGNVDEGCRCRWYDIRAPLIPFLSNSVDHVIVGRIALPLGRGRNAGDGQFLWPRRPPVIGHYQTLQTMIIVGRIALPFGRGRIPHNDAM